VTCCADAAPESATRAVIYRWRGADGCWYPGSNWWLGFVGGYEFEENGARLLNGYSGLFFYANGITPAMHTKIVGKGSQYMAAFVEFGGRLYRPQSAFRLGSDWVQTGPCQQLEHVAAMGPEADFSTSPI